MKGTACILTITESYKDLTILGNWKWAQQCYQKARGYVC
jgi:hypothetical protein